MPKKLPAAKAEQRPAGRRPRSDGQRNREELIAVARSAFTQGEINLALEEIARRAGVGIGTLYRHFPTRDALIEAVYRAEADNICAAAIQLAEDRPPVAALRDWLHLFIDYIEAKKLITPALNAMVGGPSRLFAVSGDRLKATIGALTENAARHGEIRADIDPMDLLRAVVGAANVTSIPDWQASARRLVDLLIAGARPGA